MINMWNLWTAVDGRIPRAYSQVMREGMVTAPVLVRKSAPFRWSDLELMVIPGLRNLGLIGSLQIIQTEVAPLRPVRAHPGICAAFQLSESPRAFRESEESVFSSDDIKSEVIDPEIVQLALVRRDRPHSNRMTWQTSPDAPWEIGTPGDVNATWAVLSVHKSPRTGHKGANTTQALLRFISFADANPDRLVTCNDKSQLRRAADFLAECAGKHANPSSTRLRRAEAEFRSTNIEEALNHLREGVQLRMGISPPIRRGLLRPASESLSDIERNELIYMARASSPELKVLAIRRLSTEYKYSEVRDTLKQMQNSKHAWVRAAAELCTAGQILPPASLRRIGRRLDIPLQASMQVVP